MNAQPGPIVSGKYFFPNAPLLWVKWIPACAVMSRKVICWAEATPVTHKETSQHALNDRMQSFVCSLERPVSQAGPKRSRPVAGHNFSSGVRCGGCWAAAILATARPAAEFSLVFSAGLKRKEHS